MATTNRRRVLITLQPGDGHLPPLLPLSRALRAAGHEVVFATSPTFVARVEEAGECAVGAGLGWLLSDGPAQPAEPHGQRLTIGAHPVDPGQHPGPRLAGRTGRRGLAALPGPELAVSALETLSATAGAPRRPAI